MPSLRLLVVLAAVAVVAPFFESGTAAAAVASEPECPVDLACSFVPIPSSNYDRADRPHDGDEIRYIVLHDTEERYDAAITRFQDPASAVSAHYVIRSSDGNVTQLVPTKDIAFHAGNYWFNMHSIGIEHDGALAEGAHWYTGAMYQSSARLVRYLAARYHIPLDRAHILGHEEVPGLTPGSATAMHYDPGPYWNWAHFFELLGAPLPSPHHSNSPVVTIAPRFGSNAQPMQTCTADACSDLPPQGSNVVYLHTEPKTNAPLVSDPVLHPDGSPGTTRVGDWSARAVTGQTFAVAGRQGEWTAIWFGARIAWFDDPSGRVSTPGHGPLITPRPGRSTIPVYGAAYPEAAAYPPTISPENLHPLPYTITAGQVYVGLDHGGGDYYDEKTETLVVGDRRFVELSFNHRRVFVDAADVRIQDCPGDGS